MRQALPNELDEAVLHMAEEQVLFLKNRYDMAPSDIISLYGGQPMGEETYHDAIERIAVFNWQYAGKAGFVA